MPGFADTKKRAQGLFHRPGRGRKPAFAPKSPEEAETEALTAIGQDPGQVKAHQTRWTLRTVARLCRGLLISLCRVSIKSSHAHQL